MSSRDRQPSNDKRTTNNTNYTQTQLWPIQLNDTNKQPERSHEPHKRFYTYLYQDGWEHTNQYTSTLGTMWVVLWFVSQSITPIDVMNYPKHTRYTFKRLCVYLVSIPSLYRFEHEQQTNWFGEASNCSICLIVSNNYSLYIQYKYIYYII